MDKDQFWEIIDSANQSVPDMDQESRRCQVVKKLTQLSLEEILSWHLILTEYSNAAHRNDLWAASAALGAHYTDDGFIDFRSWLISRGKEVYMNAMRDPDSLAAVPLNGEKLNFERFGSVAYEAYGAKQLRVGFDSWEAMYKALNNRTLDRQIIKDIHTELPMREDIGASWSTRELPGLFPGICKAQEPKDIAGLLKAGNIAYGYVYEDGQRTQYLFRHTPDNIANFIGGHMDAEEIIVTDTLDRLILNTNGRFIDRCSDKDLLEQVKEVLIPIQMGEATAQPFFCPTGDEVDAYCEQIEGDMTDECD